MQAEIDAQEVAANPALSAGVTPMVVDPAILLTPTGVLQLGEPEAAESGVGPSIPRETLDTLPDVPAGDRREVRVVRYENGSVALVGDAS